LVASKADHCHHPGVDFDSILKALADPTRRSLLDALAERDGQTLFELNVRLLSWNENAPTRQALSKHLALLEAAGLVRTEWQWRSKHHFLQREPLRRLIAMRLAPLAAEPETEATNEDRRNERTGR
jgi:DNA-binding transcriptional ArsR family regulator